MNPQEGFEKQNVARAFVNRLPAGGWTVKTLAQASVDAGLSPTAGDGLFPEGLPSVFQAWHQGCLDQVVAAWPPERLEPLRVRERIAALMQERWQVMDPHKAAFRIAMGAMGCRIQEKGRLGWNLAHAFWCAAGDASVDTRFYSKRLILMELDRRLTRIWLDQHVTDTEELAQALDQAVSRLFQVFGQVAALRGRIKTWRAGGAI